MDNFVKTVRIGTSKTHNGRAYSIFCKVEFKDGKLSIVGVEGPLPSGNAIGGCGQIDMHLRDNIQSIKPAPGWNINMLRRFFAIWQEWHLNDMQAGSPAQMAYLKANPVTAVYLENYYEKASEALAAAGLNPDPETGYKYGSAWLAVEVPADALEFLRSLPDTDITPAWV